MQGCHSHHSHSTHSDGGGVFDKGQPALRRALFFTLLFMVVEFVCGWVSNSLALMTDALHMLADSGALALGLFAAWLADRPSTPRMSFGYQRAEILGALTSGLAIWLLSGFLILEAVGRISDPPVVQGPMVMIVAALGLMVNFVLMRILHSSAAKTLNLRAAYLHVLADLLGSVGALISGAVLWFSGWKLIDPLMTLLLALLVLYSSWKLVAEAVGVLMESVPKGVDAEKVEAALRKISGVEEIHDLHIWAVSSNRHALSVHLISRDPDQTLEKARQILEVQFEIRHTTIQVEHPERFDSNRCYDCASG